MASDTDLQFFRAQYGLDDRCFEFLSSQPPNIIQRVLETFAPKSQGDNDYSRRLTSYIRSLLSDGSQQQERKRSFTPVAAEVVMPEIDEVELLMAFRTQYPMDERAFEFLASSSPMVRQRVVAEFRPKQEGEADYSGLVTSFVKRIRGNDQAMAVMMNQSKRPRFDWQGDSGGAAGPSGAGVGMAALAHGGMSFTHGSASPANSGLGPSLQELRAFRDRYPMDDRAWEYLCNADGFAQTKIVTTFNPRSEGDSNYGAAITAMVRTNANVGRQQGPGITRVQLDRFRFKYPMDDRAWDFLLNSQPAVQIATLQGFAPPHGETQDFSRPLTSYVKRMGQQVSHQVQTPMVQMNAGPPAFGGGGGPSFSAGGPGMWMPHGGKGKSKGGPPSGPNKDLVNQLEKLTEDEGWLLTFRALFPMDDRAWEFLSNSQPQIQQMVMTEFQPRRMDDTDYSAPVTSFVRSVTQKFQANPGHQLRQSVAESVLMAFRQRFPVDDRALEFLMGQSPLLMMKVICRFQPPRRGESDYSALLTAVVKQAVATGALGDASG